jgi:peptidoglycan/LPS O-acetylase OafA/YrhL
MALLVLNGSHFGLVLHPSVENALWSVSVAGIFAWLLLASSSGRPMWMLTVARWIAPLGTISYSLYLVHMPLLFLISAWWLTDHATLPSGLELALLGVVCSLAAAAALWLLVERRYAPRRVHQKALRQAPTPELVT